LVLCPVIAALARAFILIRPKAIAYVSYRLLINLSLLPLWPAITAYVSDKLERGTARYNKAINRMNFFLTILGLAALKVGGRVKSARANIRLSVIVNLLAGVSFLLFAQESLPQRKRTTVNTRRAGNPLSFLRVLSQSKRLKALVPILIFQAISDYNYTERMYYRTRFKWKVPEISNLMFYNRVSGMIESWVCPDQPIIQTLGIKITAQLSALLSALCDLNSAFTPMPSSVLVNSALAPLMHGRVAVSALVAREAADIGIAQGELSAALGNLVFPLRFALPTVFSEAFARLQNTLPQINFLLTAGTQVFLALVIIPKTWPSLHDLPKRVEDSYSQDSDQSDVKLPTS